MKLLIRQALINDSFSAYNGNTADIFIENGIITQIGSIQASADRVIEAHGLHVSPGWIDSFADFADPGYEQHETLETGALAAAAGGFTTVLVVPNTNPVVHNKAQVEYITQKKTVANLHPMGAITKNVAGEQLCEIFDMQASGAIAFTDGWKPLQNAQIMLKALQYVKAFNGLIVQLPDEITLSKNGLIHEGIISTQMGLPGKPAIAEHLLVARDIELLRYTGSRLHITGVSLASSVQLIRLAKAQGLQITCSTTPYHLYFNHTHLAEYDTNLKLNPPLRTPEDVEAIKQAVLDGTIDCISSHHQPKNWDAKTCEFDYAEYGMDTLEACYSAVCTAIPQLTEEHKLKLFCTNAAAIFGLQKQIITEGCVADLTLYLPQEKYIFTNELIKSKSKNNAFVGHQLTGKVLGTINNNYINI
jgi:dihydroorotase